MSSRKIFTNEGAFAIDNVPTEGSTNAVESGGVYDFAKSEAKKEVDEITKNPTELSENDLIFKEGEVYRVTATTPELVMEEVGSLSEVLTLFDKRITDLETAYQDQDQDQDGE